MFFDPLYLILIAPAFVLSLIASIRVKSTFKRYSRVPNLRGLTGAQAASQILRAEGIGDVSIEMVAGFLADHYDPRTKVLRLSPDVYRGTSIAAVGVAAHEVGHAVQHARNYAPLGLRSAIVPLASWGSNLSWILLMIGLVLMSKTMLMTGIVLFGFVVVFQLVTLPVEFNASARALAALPAAGILTADELGGVRRVLGAAALTYVAAAVMAVLQLIYFLIRAGFLGSDD